MTASGTVMFLPSLAMSWSPRLRSVSSHEYLSIRHTDSRGTWNTSSTSFKIYLHLVFLFQIQLDFTLNFKPFEFRLKNVYLFPFELNHFRTFTFLKITLTDMRRVKQQPSLEFAGRPLCSRESIPCSWKYYFVAFFSSSRSLCLPCVLGFPRRIFPWDISWAWSGWTS